MTERYPIRNVRLPEQDPLRTIPSRWIRSELEFALAARRPPDRVRALLRCANREVQVARTWVHGRSRPGPRRMLFSTARIMERQRLRGYPPDRWRQFVAYAERMRHLNAVGCSETAKNACRFTDHVLRGQPEALARVRAGLARRAHRMICLHNLTWMLQQAAIMRRERRLCDAHTSPQA